MSDTSIKIQNIYYLFLYAWDKFNEGNLVKTGTEQSPDVPNLFANVFISSVKRLIKRGLFKDYRTTNQELKFIRGKVDFNKSLRVNHSLKNKLFCNFDTLSIDSIPNKIVKRTIIDLLRNRGVNETNKKNLFPLLKYFDECSANETFRNYYSKLRLSNNNSFYKFTLNVCELLNHMKQPTSQRGNFLFTDVTDYRMSQIFETFVRNFYAIEQKTYSVSSEIIKWDIRSLGGNENYIPQNKTDVSLRSNDRTIILDTKFYSKGALKENYGKKQFNQDNLRQITSYLLNLENNEGPDSRADGILLYAKVDDEINLNEIYEWRGRKLKICTLDLNENWQNIKSNLLKVIDL